MKEATGELSTTVIAIVAIAAILAVFTVFLLPMLRSQIALTQACNNGGGYTTKYDDGKNQVSCERNTTGSWKCIYFDTDGTTQLGEKLCEQ